MTLHLRRSLVTLGVVLSLVLGLLAIRAASAWTAASAPLSVAPVSVGSLADQLAAEQGRSSALQAQLDELVARSRELSGALEETQGRIADDASTATDLRARLAAAEKKLATLTKSLRQASTARVAASGPTTAAASAAGTHEEEDEEDHGDGEHDD
jgi:TolA-binding protein